MTSDEAAQRARSALADGSMGITSHAHVRLQERGLQVADVHAAIQNAHTVIRSATNPGEAWEFHGVSIDEESICVVVGFDGHTPNVITAFPRVGGDHG